MGLETYYTVGGFVSVILLVAVGIDQAYQRLSHKWTNEPPLLPYRIPIIGHALSFSSDCLALFRAAQCGFIEFSFQANFANEILVVNIFQVPKRIRSILLESEFTCVF